ncbi:kinase-like domain-containing protein [Diplogelasinospora grovesii]|uniref:non-specific serine/threonine protein kinase n=1 Tax=Diplogelasinospora grovesii TaxID=303347 RepID=A0AAN6S4G3_9PEZI|nr:kinase-like domain-containing protein [Diplogelasinospora grovesii]
MADIDLIARLYPVYNSQGGAALDAITSEKNGSRRKPPRLVKPDLPSPKSGDDSGSREQTPEPPQEQRDTLDYRPYLELTFSHGPRTRHGFVFGTNIKTCDIVLPPDRGISKQHCTLTFEKDGFADGNMYRPVLRDLGSSNGTTVTFDGKGDERRRNFRWILGGTEIPDETEVIIIKFPYNLQFQVVIAPFNNTSPAYNQRVDRFLQGAADETEFLGGMRLLDDTPTALQSGARTPGKELIIEVGNLGAGAFGAVTRCDNVSTGLQFARKVPSAGALGVNKEEFARWDHIVRIFHAQFDPKPQLDLEYVPGGSLADKVLSPHERLETLRQCLSALEYLHGHEPPVVHRDIKLANILVQSRKAGQIHVKLADFGLVKDSRDLESKVGTPMYAAPEILGGGPRPYTSAVDIWSLGVVIFEDGYDLPPMKRGADVWRNQTEGILWCESIVAKLKEDLNEKPDGMKQFLYSTMVIVDPAKRGSAKHCYEEALRLSAPTEDGCQTPTQASYAREQTATQPHTGGDDGEAAVTSPHTRGAADPHPLPTPDDDSAVSVGTKKRARSDSPPLDFHVATSSPARKRIALPLDLSLPSVPTIHRRESPSEDILDNDGVARFSKKLENPIYVGSEVAELGREERSSIGRSSRWTTQTTPRDLPDGDAPPPGHGQQQGGKASSVVEFNDTWLREPRSPPQMPPRAATAGQHHDDEQVLGWTASDQVVGDLIGQGVQLTASEEEQFRQMLAAGIIPTDD